jgi:hypothetical protein
MPSKVGRPTDFNGTVAMAIVAAVRAGRARDAAARSAGVSPSAFYRWLQLGRAGDPRFVLFAVAVADAGTAFRRARAARYAPHARPRRPRAE